MQPWLRDRIKLHKRHLWDISSSDLRRYHSSRRDLQVYASRAKASPENNPATPLIDALLQHQRLGAVPLHIPGHKQGDGLLGKFHGILSKGASLDLTELPGLDNLACPTGPIAKSEELAAKAFGSQRCWYLVNGTSLGLQAAILATCTPGDHILVARNCHSSVLAGLTLAGCMPVWVLPEFCPKSRVALGILPETLSDAIDRLAAQGIAPKAALVVSPTYFGSCSDIRGLAEVCHQHKLPLIVDEAHGSHLGLLPEFPASALQQGADVAVQSTHKTLSALGQASMLHCQGQLISHHRISQCLRLLQTTSPSYLLMASLDAAQAQAQYRSRTELGVLFSVIQTTRQSLQSLPGVSLLESAPSGSRFDQDPWRITLNVMGLGLTGFEVEKRLQQEHKIYPELCTHQVVVFALGIGSSSDHLQSIEMAFANISPKGETVSLGEAPAHVKSLEGSLVEAFVPEMSPREAFFASKEMIACDQAVGRLSGDMLCPYPPGIPTVFPGEKLTADKLAILQHIKELGGKITGATDESLLQLSVIM